MSSPLLPRSADDPAGCEDDAGGGACCEVYNFSNILGVMGVTGYDERWEADEVRARLAAADFTLRGSEIAGADPRGHNFSFVPSGEPPARYLVTFESGSIEPFTREATERLWKDAQPAFDASVEDFENATGLRHVTYDHQPLTISGTACR